MTMIIQTPKVEMEMVCADGSLFYLLGVSF